MVTLMVELSPGRLLLRTRCAICGREVEHPDSLPPRLRMLGVLGAGEPFVFNFPGAFACANCEPSPTELVQHGEQEPSA